MEKAMSHIELLQKYEKAPAEVEIVKQGCEDMAFWEVWNLTAEPEPKAKINPEWDAWLADVEVAEKTRPKERPMVYTMGKTKVTAATEDEELQKLREAKPRLYTYPNSSEYATVFEFEDLAEGSLVCLCIKNESKQYVWKGIDFEASEEDVNRFISEVKEHCWGAESESTIEQNYQTQESQSASFLEYFD